MQAMRASHDEIFNGVFKGSRHHGTLRRLRFHGPGCRRGHQGDLNGKICFEEES